MNDISAVNEKNSEYADADLYQGRIVHAVQLMEKAQFDVARTVLQQVLQDVPEHVDALHMLGLLERRENRLPQAIALLEQCVQLRGDVADIQHNLGNLYRDASRIPEAERHYLRALELNNNAARTRMALGSLYFEAGAFTHALPLFESIVAEDAAHVDAWFNIAATCNILGQKEQKIAACYNVLKQDHAHAAAWHLLAESHVNHEDGAFKHMQLLWERGQDTLDVESGAHLCFGLGKMYEDVQKYSDAYAWFERGNRLKRRSYTYDIYQSEIMFEMALKLMDKQWIAARSGVGIEDEAPVFVVGMPRSGTSLIEQILASHSHVHGAGELKAIQRLMSVCEQKSNARYPAIVQRLADDTYTNLGKAYLQEIHARGGDALRVVDKMPTNFLYLGLIHVALPKAKFIYCARDVSDNAMSIFKHLFGDYMPYGYDMWEIGRMQKMHYHLMEHWKKVIPEENLLVVRYESVVKDIEGQSRRMLDFLGLEWDDACLKFYETQREGEAQNSHKVRQPIYESSVGIARHYAKHLSALEAAWVS